MIIKDKPFRIPSCQAMACCCYYPAVVIRREIAIPESIFCTHDLVRRLPGFVKLEAYQVRLARIAADRWADRQPDFSFNRLKSSIAARRRFIRLFDELGYPGGVL